MNNDYYKYVGPILVQHDLQERRESYFRAINEIAIEKNIRLEEAEKRFTSSLCELNELEERLKRPLLGSHRTRHGEAAEEIYRFFGNADRLIQGKRRVFKPATGRTTSEDLLRFGRPVQLKSYDSLTNSLEACIIHMRKYSNEGHMYVIPKDQHELFTKIENGDYEGINPKTVKAIKEKIEIIKKLFPGKKIGKIIQPNELNYNEINPNNNYQEDQYNAQIDKKRVEITNQNEKQENKINSEATKEKNNARQQSKASVSKSIEISSLNGLLSGTLSSSTLLYAKLKSGKKIEDFTKDDWSEIGLTFVTEGSKGFASSFSIYWLSNNKYALGSLNNEIRNPNNLTTSATLIVNTAITIAELYNDYKKGDLDSDDFIDSCYSASLEQAIVSAGALLGASIPIIGPIIGSTIARYTYRFVAVAVDSYDTACSNLARARFHNMELRFKEEYAEYEKEILANFVAFDKLLEMVTTPSINKARSIKACEMKGIKPETDMDIFLNQFPNVQ